MSVNNVQSLDIPNLKVEKYVTKFGPHQDDVIVIDFNYTPTPTTHTTWSLQDVVIKALPNFNENYLNDLVSLGSVYLTRYQTGSCSTVSNEEKSRRWHRRVKERFKRNHGLFAENTPRITQRLINSTESGIIILPQATLSLRLHVTPQRFPITPYIDWRSRVCYMNDDFVIVNKPGGIPSQPVASNYQECVHVQAGLSLFQTPLYPTSRLDLWSTGLLCLGRHPAAVKQVNEWHRNNSLQKTYRVLSYHNPLTSPLLVKSLSLPLTLQNWMPKGPIFGVTVPRLLCRAKHPDMLHCVLRITSIQQVFFSQDFQVPPEEPMPIPYCSKMTEEIKRLKSLSYDFYDIHIQLMTGRTHQIRAQLACFGLCLVGDTIYAPFVGAYVDSIPIQRLTKDIDFSNFLERKEEPTNAKELTETEKEMWQLYIQSKPITYPIGSFNFLYTINHTFTL
ncbi:uncharacterized protein LOC128883919 [Hylaeus volcanicus]|uniref:uncharacterized protein LOC128883919 n=1 Tax=Hylaeus volcanicus TaxID=313075 RepID=UPI0023B7EAED|nr:uncharacterized protein LOC128883919 [Hylaeus volcanicus]